MKRWLKSNDSASDEANEKSSTSKVKRRKFCNEYLAFGFTSTNLNGEERPQCVICYEVLSNESMKPAKLRRHLETKHQDLREKSKSFFQIKASELERSKKTMMKTATGTNNENAVLASYQVSLLVAKSGKPHTIAEELILPCAKIMVSAMLGDKASKELDIISLSNSTVKSRIDEMSGNVKEQLILNVKASPFYALQLDESTDISNDANLLAYVRYEHNDGINEDLLFCMPLPSHTTGEAIFEVLNKFMSTHEIPWDKCVAVSTDGARAMTGTRIGLQARVKKMNPSIVWHHCCIHREALAAKNMPEKLKTVLDDIVQVVNFIKARPLNSRIFGMICEEMGSIHKQLLLHAEVRWLSRGKVVSRVFELRDEIRIFFLKNSVGGANKHADKFNDFGWLSMAAYLADIFNALNELNLGLQGRDNNIFQVEDKIETMLKKIDLWTNRTIKQNYNHFPTLAAFLESSGEATLSTQVQDEMIKHLRTLRSSFRNYFPVPDKNKTWIVDPFNTDVTDIIGLTTVQENQLIEISCDSALKRTFKEFSLSSFWLNVKKDYKEISEEALKHLLLFSTTYLCEKAFSALVYTKNKYRNRLHVESDLRLQLNSNINPNITNLVAKKQHQPSH
ncbi:zinc finger BED domain-containing protein 5-like [Vanessa cardui]|uniref:zinc finger BED domain-containing protein 5-like n=1 Tax=Vanessa cardui TaxID=171605 RepID=UPI001F131D56|nr:zinc finger BED domain-containing protein 5-like [Vanessa cardui]